MNLQVFNTIVLSWTAVGVLVLIALLYVVAPYGRHTKRTWGPLISNKLGWVIMELPSLILFSVFFLWRDGSIQALTWIFFLLYVAHYVNRSLIYPFRTKTAGKKMPLLIALFAIFFNLMNGSLNGLYFAHFARDYSLDWLYDARFIIGLSLFVAGVVINHNADNYLLGLRNGGGKHEEEDKSLESSESGADEVGEIKSVGAQNQKTKNLQNTGSGNGYKIPQGRLFRYVSCPNFSGEILEWTGFAVMTWSPAALAFALWTVFNLVPRALEHHKWYKEHFDDYPEERKALIPFVL